MEYTAIIKKQSNGWYFAQCEQIPNAITQGETIDEALENLKDAIQFLLEDEMEDFRKIIRIPIPRHAELGDIFCNEICTQLGIPKIKYFQNSLGYCLRNNGGTYFKLIRGNS